MAQHSLCPLCALRFHFKQSRRHAGAGVPRRADGRAALVLLLVGQRQRGRRDHHARLGGHAARRLRRPAAFRRARVSRGRQPPHLSQAENGVYERHLARHGLAHGTRSRAARPHRQREPEQLRGRAQRPLGGRRGCAQATGLPAPAAAPRRCGAAFEARPIRPLQGRGGLQGLLLGRRVARHRVAQRGRRSV
ncbi:MAG: hypothetical protein BWX70_03252 [Verrucomicrobia bacterium ADurb.Bin070]|nr:MAG: hypothetical protein BWX70_03252 [Verrucomicrobia bacterium ADurb.Bin070]